MNLIEKTTKKYSTSILERYRFDSLKNSGDMIELFAVLMQHDLEISSFSVNFDHDHTTEGKPVKLYEFEELKRFISRLAVHEIMQIDFEGKLNGNDRYGTFFSQTSILHVHAPLNKICNDQSDNQKLVKGDIKKDRYYKFSGGKIIKRSGQNGLFYSQDKNSDWVVDGHAMSKFYDAASDYIEIEKPNFDVDSAEN